MVCKRLEIIAPVDLPATWLDCLPNSHRERVYPPPLPEPRMPAQVRKALVAFVLPASDITSGLALPAVTDIDPALSIAANKSNSSSWSAAAEKALVLPLMLNS